MLQSANKHEVYLHIVDKSGGKQQGNEKFWLEYVKLPLVATIVSGVLTLGGITISHQYENSAKEKELVSSQIDAVSKLSLEFRKDKERVKPADIGSYVSSLVSYGKYSIPMLVNILSRSNQADELYQIRFALAQLAALHDARAEVRDIILLFLNDKWSIHEIENATVAIQILVDVDKGSAMEFLNKYEPAKRIKQWDAILRDTAKASCEDFKMTVIELAPRFADVCDQGD